jgi:ribosomal protein L40E
VRPHAGQRQREDFQELQASVLFCARCQAAQPVRERLLLVLPDGELFEYLCARCGAQVGKRKATAAPAPLLIAR